MSSPISARIRANALSFPALFVPLFLAHAAHAQSPSAPGSAPWPYDDVTLPGPLPPASALPADTPPAVPEPPSARFGAQGQVVLGGGTSIGISSTQYDASDAKYFSAGVSPELDYFVLKNFSIGLSAGLTYGDSRGYDSVGNLMETQSTSFSAGPRFGLNVPLGDFVSWWLLGTLGFESNRSTTSLVTASTTSTAISPGTTQTSQDGPWVSLYLPLLVHPVPHFFMGAGPSIFHEFAVVRGAPDGSGDQRTTIGGSFLVGGYWGGAPDAPKGDASGAASTRPLSHLGDRGQVVFTNELTAAAGSSSYAGSPSSTSSGQLTFGMDYFFVDHVAVGFGVSGGWDSSSGVDSSGNGFSATDTSYGFFLRTAAHLPLAGPVSLYPRVALGVGGGSSDEKSAGGENTYSISEVWLTGYLPLAVEVAPHFFVGFGPSATRDLSNTATFAQGQQLSNPGTRLGAGFLLGGWL